MPTLYCLIFGDDPRKVFPVVTPSSPTPTTIADFRDVLFTKVPTSLASSCAAADLLLYKLEEDVALTDDRLKQVAGGGAGMMPEIGDVFKATELEDLLMNVWEVFDETDCERRRRLHVLLKVAGGGEGAGVGQNAWSLPPAYTLAVHGRREDVRNSQVVVDAFPVHPMPEIRGEKAALGSAETLAPSLSGGESTSLLGSGADENDSDNDTTAPHLQVNAVPASQSHPVGSRESQLEVTIAGINQDGMDESKHTKALDDVEYPEGRTGDHQHESKDASPSRFINKRRLLIGLAALIIIGIAAGVGAHFANRSQSATADPSSSTQPAAPPTSTSPPPLPTYPALSSSTNATAFNDDGLGSITYLDRHDVSCPNNYGLSEFQLQAGGPANNYHIAYTCLTASDFGPVSPTFYTGANSDGGGDAIFLDRHPVACADGSVVNEWRVNRPTNTTIQIQFRCVSVPGLSHCVDKTTEWVNRALNVVALENQDVSCPSNTMLTKWQLGYDQGTRIQYRYTCCGR